jgi:uncharacterized membrane protein YgcG
MAALSEAEIQGVIDAWPADDTGLPASVRTAVDAWTALTLGPINTAIQNLNDDPALTWQTPTGRGYLKVHKVRTLVAHGVAATAGGPTPLPADLRSMTAAPDAISEKIRLMEQQLAAQRDEIAASRLEISGLQRVQDAIDTEKDVTADYVVNDTVAAATPDSFVTHIPLSKKERRQRTHRNQGSFPKYPNKLVLKESTKNSKDMQKAQKLTLPQYAVEVQKFLDRNDHTTKMAGTCWSHVLDMTTEVQSSLTSDSDAWYRADDILDRLLVVQNCAESAFTFGLDASVHMRLSVANRVDTAMGIKHLRVDPLKRGEDDFISDDTYKLIKAEAEKKQNLTWAKQGDFPRSKAGSFFGKPPQKKTPWGGKSNKTSKSGRGGGGKGGRGRGRGKGRGKDSGGRGSGEGSNEGD